MIPASLLLILVAVTLLALGLTGGSSTLLISSIVASLLAAVALVIGARQAAGARRAAEAQEPAAEFSASRFDEPDFAAAPEFVAEHEFAAAVADEQARRDDFPPDDEPFAADSPTSGAPAPGSRDTVQFASVRDDGQ